ncbi:DNA dC-_dU-editing enzyme APOBEC-3H-like isoform X3 [Molossus molossus]|uniref:DNA dC->dU-editing enzyme APOBEC-3H-like isoform X3 n=1 Tax=Molossus molossus TaxID=27622 RepID=UPI00174653CF|nr:DNA dC->dU-editing enzyme APOBEC-3H-like isoform X3 [Molossus molossus]
MTAVTVPALRLTPGLLCEPHQTAAERSESRSCRHPSTPPSTVMRNTMNLLTESTFCYQFGNQHKVKEPNGRRKTYLCYQLKLPDGQTLHKDYIKNKKKQHAEICFIDKINSLNLDKTKRYDIICFITWSPCPFCAKELVAFIKDCPHLSLEIFASRLYFHWIWGYQVGLQSLRQPNIQVSVMREKEFADCWENFVDNQGKDFKPWEKLTQYSTRIRLRLERILGKTHRTHLASEQSSECIQDENDCVDAIRNLNLDAHHPHYEEWTQDACS